MSQKYRLKPVLLNREQDRPCSEGFMFLDRDARHSSGARRFHLILHLHRFQYHQTLSRRYYIADRDEYPHHFPRHRSLDSLPTLGLS